ncbi:hypothetical protein ABT317_32415, partial [Streptomyces carpinensis]
RPVRVGRSRRMRGGRDSGRASSRARARLTPPSPDARVAAHELTAAGIALLDEPSAAVTGWTVEIADPWGNVLGFTDYTKRRELGRRP